MATRGAALVATIQAINVTTGLGVIGDAANITPRKIADGVSSPLAVATVTEADATYGRGLYNVSLTGAESDCNLLWLCGVSSTPNVIIIPILLQMERLPDAAPGGNGGLPTVNGSNQIADPAGVATLLARLTSTRAIYLDALQYVTDARLTWLERLGTGLEETSTGSGIWRWTTLALSRLGMDVTAIRGKTDTLPADPASNTQVLTRMASFAYTAPDNAGIGNAAASAATAAAQATTAAAQSATAATQSTTAATQATNAAASASSADGKLTAPRLANIDAATPTRLGILDRLASMMEQVSGLWRWTTNTLSQAPTGSGGGGSAGKQLVHTPLRLVLAQGENCESCQSDRLTLTRGTKMDIRLNLVDADAAPVPTTGTDLTAKLTTMRGALIVALADGTVVETLASEGQLTVSPLDTSIAELVGINQFKLVVTRDNGAADVQSGEIIVGLE